MLLDELKWKNIPSVAAKKLAVLVLSKKGQIDLDSLVFEAAEAKLPFYKNFRLYRVGCTDRDDGFAVTSYALWDAKNVIISISGENDSVRTANDFEHLQLPQSVADDYVRFFLFCVRGGGGSFNLVESLPEQSLPGTEIVAPYVTPLEYLGVGEDGRYRYKAIIAYNGTLFSSVMAVSENGAIEMDDDTMLVEEVPEGVIPAMPSLDGASLMMEHLLRKLFKVGPSVTAVANSKSSTTSNKSALVTLAEILLEQAMSSQSRNRLISHFNAIQSTDSGLGQLANLVADASPIIAIESNLPFIGEVIADIVINSIAMDEKRTKPCLATVSDQHSNLDVLNNNAIVLLPLQVLSTTVNLERIFHDMATKDLAVIITCDKFNQMPEGLRAITDIVLKLPAMNADIFDEWFERVIGFPAPDGWRQQGEVWNKYVLHTDFEHPRRMRLSASKAFEYIRDQVNERMAAVDPVQSLGLKDLHGLGEARQFAEDLIADIHAAIQGEIPWEQVDRGALLTGLPGTGKTTLAKAIAKDCNVKFIQTSATNWQTAGHLSDHIFAIRKTFADARRYAPSILFIDEIDSLGSREQLSGEYSQYYVEVINAVLEQMQGLDADAPVFVLGATNHEDKIDPALKRSGRMDRIIRIPRPNGEALGQIYKHYLKNLAGDQVDANIDLATLGKMSLGLSGADVERIVRGAMRRARKERRALTQLDIVAEITNKPRSTENIRRITMEELERIAFHEAGHAMARCMGKTNGADIGFVTIVPRDDGTLGFVSHLPSERVSFTRSDYLERIEFSLAGRAAEAIRYGEENVSGGAVSDLAVSTTLAVEMITRLGLGSERKLLWSEIPTEEDREQASQLLLQAYDRIVGKLRENQAALANLAEELVARQELMGEDVRRIILQYQGKS